MAGDYIPAADAEFTAWLDSFLLYTTPHMAELGLELGDVAPISLARNDWLSAHSAHVTAQAAAQSARQAKTPHPRGRAAAPRGIKFPISLSVCATML
jgi:hypothetical protein